MRVLIWGTSVVLVLATALRATDSDGDGVPDELDVCPNTPAGMRVDPHGRPACDFNLDCVVNGLDMPGFIQQLMTAPGAPGATTLMMLSPTPESSGYFGISVAAVADVDGDGLTDVLVGAKLENPVGTPNDCGRAHLYSGRTGVLIRNFSSPHQESDGRFGWGVGAVPDVNGDGRGDVVVGAPLEDPPGGPPNSGQAYVFSGASGALLATLHSPSPTQNGLFGFTVAGIRDLNGDGHGDVIVGAWHESGPGNPSDTGRVHVFSGATGALLFTILSPNQVTGGQFGVSVASVHDVNGDSLDDIVVGAAGETPSNMLGAGRGYVFSGANGSLLRTLVSPLAQELGNFGVSVSGVPDADGDQRGDVVVGASAEVPAGGSDPTGRAYIFSGSSGLLLHALDSLNGSSYGEFGNAVAGVADIDGDGRGDVVIGAATDGDSGRVYVFSGASGGLIQALISPNADPGSLFGFSVAGAADASGDGRGDVIVAALFENPPPNPTDSGTAYLFNLADADADGVANGDDQCPNTPGSVPVDLHGRPWADLNGDCQISIRDVDGFVSLLLGQ